jgi:hypothetical protein
MNPSFSLHVTMWNSFMVEVVSVSVVFSRVLFYACKNQSTHCFCQWFLCLLLN